MRGDQPPPDGTPPAAAPNDPELETLRKDLAKAEQRYAKQLKEAEDRIKALEEEVRAKLTQTPPDTGVTDDERNLLGPDVVTVIEKVARASTASVVQEQLRPLHEQLDKDRKMREAEYTATLDDLVPGWEQQNNDPKFLAWLDEPDPATGRMRLDLIRRADAAQQGYRTAEIFLAFREQREIGSRDPKPRQQQDIQPPNGTETQPVVTGEEVKGVIYTRAEVAQFYRDKREGKFKTKEALARAREKEQDILKASNEGRIR